MHIKLYTRSSNDALYARMREFIPEHIECERCTQFQEWWQAKDYLMYIMKSDADIVINCDEDCFITDWGIVNELIYELYNGKWDYAGMPDGGVSPHRSRSWCVLNPFFNVFNLSKIRPVLEQYPDWVINSAGFNADWENYKPRCIKEGTYNHDYVEPFSSFFYFLYDKFNTFFLYGDTLEDNITTVLNDGCNPYIYHSWYAREFNTDPTHRERILKVYEQAKMARIVR